MEVILLEKIHRLGNLGDKVNVAPGYGRNFLIPNRKAVPATAANVAKFEEQRAELERVQADALGRAEKVVGAALEDQAAFVQEAKMIGGALNVLE